MTRMPHPTAALRPFHPIVARWFAAAFPEPTPPQAKGWPVIARGDHTLLLAPTGSGKTLTGFLWAINRLMFEPPPDTRDRCRVLYLSPLKALAVDVERNLRAPLAGISRLAREDGVPHHLPEVAIRTGDTPAADRARFQRHPADILITTPESLYLLLTSNARDVLRGIHTVILDEIHAMVATKRGAHLALSLERLAHVSRAPFQRVGLSATQRPLEEVARFLGGAADAASSTPDSRLPTPAPSAEGEIHDQFAAGGGPAPWRPVTIVDAGRKRQLSLHIEVPVEDMARLTQVEAITSGPAAAGPQAPSIWAAIHPRLLEVIRAHTSTLLFVNSRRLAERLAAAINELAGETLVRAHHGSLAREQRVEIEDALKAGRLRGLACTSSLELGIDMGAVDLVVQIEAPPSVASGLQRIGRAGHRVDATSEGLIFPKYRGDLLACAAAVRAMREGRVEATHMPRNPLDVLAQQIVAMVAMDDWPVDALFARVRQAAPFASLARPIFDGVLDMLSGRYPSDEFAELRPRLTWDRVAQTLTTREGARRVAIANAGTIPDRGLYGVFLAGASAGTARVGELDEEMVFESRVGETFLLGASTWRIEDISHDRVLVSPAPGEPGKMPFWKGDGPGRPLEFGREIGALVRQLRRESPEAAATRLVEEHDLDERAASNLVQYLAEQDEATGAVPDDRTIVIERVRDELGDWRLCLLSPLGGQVLAPWAMAVMARLREQYGYDVETMWADDGFVVRFPEGDEPPDPQWLVPDADEVESLVLRQLGSTSLFAARFRECAGRALLLPRRRPGKRAPLWQQRKRAQDLLGVAARYGSFPILLETYRECLRDVFDIPALIETLRAVQARQVRVVHVETPTPSPFAASLLFGYVANYLYDGDAPLAERRAQALTIDQSQLQALLGSAELRDLLDADALSALEAQLQCLLPEYRARTLDGLHDLLLRIGDLSPQQVRARVVDEVPVDAGDQLVRARRAVWLTIGGESRLVAIEDAARYRDALGVPLPQGVPESLLGAQPQALRDLVSRYARTHGPFTTDDVAARFGLGRSTADLALRALLGEGRLLEGEFRPGGQHQEWCDAQVLSTVRRRSLARLRHAVEPVEMPVLGRMLTQWQGVTRPRRGLDALLDVIETLQGVPLPASLLEREILPARIERYQPSDLDALISAGEIVWTGVEPLGEHDGRVALYLTDHLPTLWRGALAAPGTGTLEARAQAILAALEARGALFFAALHEAAGGGFPQDTVDALWTLVWQGLLTNDTLQPLRAHVGRATRERRGAARPFRSRRVAPPTAEGRWARLPVASGSATPTAWSAAMGQQLLTRYGLVTREVAAAENLPGGFSAIYDVFRTLEEGGRIRRGYFVTGVGAMQFATPAAVDLLRALRTSPESAEVAVLAATDPANPYGALVKWPEAPTGSGRGPTRSVGARVVLVDGHLAAWIGRGLKSLIVWLPEHEPDRTRHADALARVLPMTGTDRERRAANVLLAEINGGPALDSPIRPHLEAAGFVATSQGLQWRDATPASPATPRQRRPGRWQDLEPVTALEDLPPMADEDIAPIRWPRRPR
ncbi:DEAD/DEAH box helicase [Luteitalea sp. TBR-22]|uniref:Lhr family helicase n=1 Tax=Luteitalea sp. TBR-22 TaxID=2802971 RepID=UPI00351CE7A8